MLSIKLDQRDLATPFFFFEIAESDLSSDLQKFIIAVADMVTSV